MTSYTLYLLGFSCKEIASPFNRSVLVKVKPSLAGALKYKPVKRAQFKKENYSRSKDLEYLRLSIILFVSTITFIDKVVNGDL